MLGNWGIGELRQHIYVGDEGELLGFWRDETGGDWSAYRLFPLPGGATMYMLYSNISLFD